MKRNCKKERNSNYFHLICFFLFKLKEKENIPVCMFKFIEILEENTQTECLRTSRGYLNLLLYYFLYILEPNYMCLLSYQACSPTYHSLWNHLIYLNLIESQLFIEELLTRIRYQLSTLNNNAEDISKGVDVISPSFRSTPWYDSRLIQSPHSGSFSSQGL